MPASRNLIARKMRGMPAPMTNAAGSLRSDFSLLLANGFLFPSSIGYYDLKLDIN